MGEPMNNYDEVALAVQIMIDPQAFALRRSAVTISTVGVIPRMLQMMTDLPGVSLALSLHAPTQELRKTIVPSAKAYPLDKLMAAVDKYQMQTRQKVTAAAQCCQETGSSMNYVIGFLDCYTSLYSLCFVCCVLHNFSNHSISFLLSATSKKQAVQQQWSKSCMGQMCPSNNAAVAVAVALAAAAAAAAAPVLVPVPVTVVFPHLTEHPSFGCHRCLLNT